MNNEPPRICQNCSATVHMEDVDSGDAAYINGELHCVFCIADLERTNPAPEQNDDIDPISALEALASPLDQAMCGWPGYDDEFGELPPVVFESTNQPPEPDLLNLDDAISQSQGIQHSILGFYHSGTLYADLLLVTEELLKRRVPADFVSALLLHAKAGLAQRWRRVSHYYALAKRDALQHRSIHE